MGNGILCRDSLCDNPLPGTAPDSGFVMRSGKVDFVAPSLAEENTVC